MSSGRLTFVSTNICGHLSALQRDMDMRQDHYLQWERVLLITALALLIVAFLAIGKVGAFASFDSSSIVGFSCIGATAFIALIKGFFLSLPCCTDCLMSHTKNTWKDKDGKLYHSRDGWYHSSDGWSRLAQTVEFTEEDRQNAISL